MISLLNLAHHIFYTSWYYGFNTLFALTNGRYHESIKCRIRIRMLSSSSSLFASTIKHFSSCLQDEHDGAIVFMVLSVDSQFNLQFPFQDNIYAAFSLINIRDNLRHKLEKCDCVDFFWWKRRSLLVYLL